MSKGMHGGSFGLLFVVCILNEDIHGNMLKNCFVGCRQYNFWSALIPVSFHPPLST